MNKRDAEEFTQSLGQIVSGSWRQIALAERMGVPAALGMSTKEWVNNRLGGYIRLSIEERREAVKDLTEEGFSTREAGEILGVSNATVSTDVKNLTEPDDNTVYKIGPPPSNQTCKVEDLAAITSTFGCIYADPPWLYDNQGTRSATRNHYAGMTVDELCALPIKKMAADDAHLHLWITNGFLFDAPKIFDAWGFEFRSSLIWVKPQMGIGNYWRNSHEFLLTAIRGDAKRFKDKSLKSWIEVDRGEHSQKPEQVRSMIERASPGPYLELFGRLPIDGWTVWGNQIEKNLFYGKSVA